MGSKVIRRAGTSLVAVLLALLAGPATPEAPDEEEIAYTSHGSFMNRKGEVIEHPSQAAIEAYYAKVGTRAPTDTLPAPRSHRQYCADCLAEGVPEPPALDSGKWVSKGNLGPDGHFTSQRVVDILVYESADPAGVCVALPRRDDGFAEIQLVGVICQSQTTGKACFWDNVANDKPATEDGSDDRITFATIGEFDVSKFRNGDQLFEDCTNCHRGDNVFMIHGAELESVPRRAPAQRYKPIPEGTKPGYVPEVERVWSNPGRRRQDDPEELNLMRADGCGECHKMPALSWPYCTSVLRPAITRDYMPPGGFSASDRDSLQCRDFCVLLRECVLLSPQEMSGQEVWGLFGSAPADCGCADRWQSVWPIAKATPD
jgi:hypothetical protein